MKRLTQISLLLLMCCVALQVNADETKNYGTFRSVYGEVPSGYERVGETNIYAGIAWGNFYDPSTYTFDLYGQFNGEYYGSTYSNDGYKAAFKVGDNPAVVLDCAEGTTDNGVSATAAVMPLGDFARICYTLTNTTEAPVTVSIGVWADVMIGNNDHAPIERRLDPSGNVYGLTMKNSTTVGDVAFSAIFGVQMSGVTIVDDYWFGSYSQNKYPEDIVGNYTPGSNWMVENGSYDSGMGWCWKNREIQPGESVEFAYLIGVGDVNFSYAEFEVEPTNLEVWNDLDEIHDFNINGIYVSPLGHNGTIYVQVDESDEWVEIPGVVLSGGNFSLPFSVLFTEGLASHELRFRIIDEVGNATDLGSVSWADVSAYPVTGAFEDRVYNGQEQTYTDLSYEMNPDNWVTYYTDNIYPGTGYFVTEGLYPYTIGRVLYPFFIDKAPCEYTVDMPDELIPYDGESHGATVTVPEGTGVVTVTYVNVVTGQTTTQEPVQPGVYEVYVEITEGEYYYGIGNTLVGEFEIEGDPTGVDEISVENAGEAVIYNMQGARVKNVQPGLYIINGKKVLVQ